MRVNVAVGVVFDSTGRVLVAKRHLHQHQGACWEFPGGKIEPGESSDAALKRELREEVGIEVIDHEPWLVVDHDYPDKLVSLKVYKVTQFSGVAMGCLNQEIRWLIPSKLLDLPWPQANISIVKALNDKSPRS
jgi:8-oxo-dGTP diphosphatase